MMFDSPMYGGGHAEYSNRFEEDSVTLGEQLSGARVVRHDEDRGYTLAWFGGHGVHAYAEDGTEIAYWNIGDFANNDADEDEVIADMDGEIESGDYLERY